MSVSYEGVLTQADVSHIRARGQDPAEVVSQLETLRLPRKSVPILRPATIGDGIQRLEDYDHKTLLGLHEEARAAGRIAAFVPASGGGTRLFHALLHLYRNKETQLEHVRWRASRGDEVARDALVVLENIAQFAFWPELERRGCSTGNLEQVLALLFGDGGLRYHELPKGLIPFHRYDTGVVTAFAEHLHEAAALIADRDQVGRMHFTIADVHRKQFEDELKRDAPDMERALGVRLRVDFSSQAVHTDTIATDLDGCLRRDRAGQIAFHPGGHGALLHNLGSVGADVVLIKNIDNIARRELLPQISAVRRQISGVLLQVERQVHNAVRELRDGRDPASAIQFLDQQFGVTPRTTLPDAESRRNYAIAQLSRPIRVCGVVSSLDHAGGRPFWTDTASRGPCLQIIEGAEINLDNPRERKLFHRSRHFNPVDIACSLRDADGKTFDLPAFAIPDRAIIAKKVLAGVPALVYEHPGLWNGGMGLWNTVFVEIPDVAFNPVKSMSALWAPGHRP